MYDYILDGSTIGIMKSSGNVWMRLKEKKKEESKHIYLTPCDCSDIAGVGIKWRKPLPSSGINSWTGQIDRQI